MKNRIYCFVLIVLNSLMVWCASPKHDSITLSNNYISISWVHEQGGWCLKSLNGRMDGKFHSYGNNVGEYSFIYSAEKPTTESSAIVENGDTLSFPEKSFKYVYPDFQRSIRPVSMNRAGKYISFFPKKVVKSQDAIIFEEKTSFGTYKVIWQLDKKYPKDILLNISIVASRDGYYSLPSPTLCTLTEEELAWGCIPGYYQGAAIQKDFPLAYAYAQGLPRYPVLCRESTLTTMASLMTNKSGLTMAVIPEPGQDRNPYEKDKVTHVEQWKVALSHMNYKSELSPVAYHPVLGESNSYLKVGETANFRVRVTLQESDWYEAYKHAIYDIYQLKQSFDVQKNELSLSERLMKLYDYVLDDKSGLWQKETYQGREIMAQSYMSGVAGADNDAMKNSDIGAVWMLARLTGDSLFNSNRIPYIRNFKILQQNQEGFFKGAVNGQYYLSKSKRFTEEWGTHFEPVAITYYSLADLGNILLFEPNNEEIRGLLKNSANRLLEWQQVNGSWAVAYERSTHEPVFTDLTDFRPTFYGLIIAYKALGDKKYLQGAIKGADWIIENSCNKGYFLGDCGDVRFVNDFSTMQIAGGLLELYEMTSEQRYLDAAVKTARMYTTSIYTHPIPTEQIRTLNGEQVKDWQISQVGLNFEHGGSMGSAVNAGPVLLTSHCAMFIKLYQLTGDKLFRDLARIGAQGKDAFVNKDTGVASYYWVRFDQGAGPFPHHAWWQIGWIYDYLLAEAELRSDGDVSFPRGFMTPKVGPHRTTGFESGLVNGQKAKLVLRKDLVRADNPNIDYLTALSEDRSTLFVILLNGQAKDNTFNLSVNTSILEKDKKNGEKIKKVTLEPFGSKILKFSICPE